MRDPTTHPGGFQLARAYGIQFGMNICQRITKANSVKYAHRSTLCGSTMRFLTVFGIKCWLIWANGLKTIFQQPRFILALMTDWSLNALKLFYCAFKLACGSEKLPPLSTTFSTTAAAASHTELAIRPWMLGNTTASRGAGDLEQWLWAKNRRTMGVSNARMKR